MSEASGGHSGSWPSYALPRGTIVHGYKIVGFLGSGGFGVTYLARDEVEQPFAIKEYFPRDFATRHGLTVVASSEDDAPLFEECLDRFRREARALVRLSNSSGTNDGIVGVVTYFTANGTAFLVMKYVEGVNLKDVLNKEKGGLAPQRVSALLSQLLSSVGAVHRAGLFHRDIKPANIMLRGDGRAVLIDFGSSREATVGPNRPHTQIYSLGYSPLEQMLGQRQGAFSDIYAIGAVCYHAIGGKVVASLIRHNTVLAGRPDPQPSAEQVGAGRYPPPLLQAIDAALAINPEKRPQSVDAMLAILAPGKGADKAPVAGVSPLPASRTARSWKKPLVLAGGTAAVIVALLAFAPGLKGLLSSGGAGAPGTGPPAPVAARSAPLPDSRAIGPDKAGPGPVTTSPPPLVPQRPGSPEAADPSSGARVQGGSVASPTPAPRPPAPKPTEFPIDVATEQTILNHSSAETGQEPAIYRFRENPRILVLDFAFLRDHGRMLNRAAALVEKNLPHDRVLNDDELDAAIRASGDTLETFDYGHDYGAASLVRFFTLADRDKIPLLDEEEALRRLIRQEGWFAPNARASLISIPRIGADMNISRLARATILLHELSMAEYFTNPPYALFVHRFWTQTLTADECDGIRHYLRSLGYDPNLDEVMENEAQAYLMFTKSPEFFKPDMVGMTPARLTELRSLYLSSMPPGWLRDRLNQFLAEINSEGGSRR